jgi:hypothetical protein
MSGISFGQDRMKHVVHDDADRIDGLDQLAARFRQARELAAQSSPGQAQRICSSSRKSPPRPGS